MNTDRYNGCRGLINQTLADNIDDYVGNRQACAEEFEIRVNPCLSVAKNKER